MRVLIAVTHLLGAGHLTRCAAIGRALVRAGHAVTLVSGGQPTSLAATGGIDVVQMPPVRAHNQDFRDLRQADGEPVDGPYRIARRAALLGALARAAPDIVVTELFPFGRRVLRDEFGALLDAADAMRPRPAIVASVRDILATPRPDRVADAHATVARLYDAVLVHGDPDFVPLDASWPVDDALRARLLYTGYVDDGGEDCLPGTAAPTGEIIVAGGSSSASLPLYWAALAAARLRPGHRWRVLVGRGVPEPEFAALGADRHGNMAVERARPDFRVLLGGAALFVGQCGYNTALDVLAAGTRALFVPFEAGGETEQRLRAEQLAETGRAAFLPEAELNGPRLAEAVTAALVGPRAAPTSIRRDGADASVRHLVAIAGRRAAVRPAVLHPPLPGSLVKRVHAALDRSADAGHPVRVWWRDDDAVAHTAALDRLLALRARVGCELAVAAVPALADGTLVDRLAGDPEIGLLVHGWRHANHAPAGAKRSEFGTARRREEAECDLRAGLARMRELFGERALAVFVPPWNRMAQDLAASLPRLGYAGLSAAGDGPREVPGLAVAGTHLDPVDWRGSRGLLDPERIVAALEREAGRSPGSPGPRPIGVLTHHLVHDEMIWAFCEDFLNRLRSRASLGTSLAALFRPGTLWNSTPIRTLSRVAIANARTAS